MATYNLLQCKFWTTKDVPVGDGEKQFAYYFLTLEGVEAGKAVDALWKTSPSTPEPTPGEIEGTVEKTDRGWKFTKGKGELRKPNFEAAIPSKPNTGRDEPFQKGRQHPAEVAGSRYSAAAHIAIDHARLLAYLKAWPPDGVPPGDEREMDAMENLIEWYVAKAREASERAAS